MAANQATQQASWSLNWEEAYARLEGARQALASLGQRSPAETRRILRERAKVLASPLEAPEAPVEALDLVVFSLAGDQYGIEVASVREVIPLPAPTPVPCTPTFVLGVILHRGGVLPVVDLRRFLELPEQRRADESRAIIVATENAAFGILADAVMGVVHLGAHEITSPTESLRGGQDVFIRGVTREMVAVLDLDTLVRDPRFVVNE